MREVRWLVPGMVLVAGLLAALPAQAADCNKNGIEDAWEASANGLVGYYYNNTSWTPPYTLAQIDPTIDFPDDGTVTFPPAGIPTDYFSVRWMGTLLTTSAAGWYRLSVEHDDGFRLYLNGVLVPNMSDDGNTTNTVDVQLTADTKYHIRLDYIEKSGGQKCIFRWRLPGETDLSVVPSSNLLAIYDSNANGIPDECEFGDCNANGMPDSSDISSGRSTDCNANGIPDECDFSSGGDCDNNGVLDACEAALPANGLVGQYWSSSGGSGNYSTRLLVRVDPNINFDWAGNAPATGVPSNDFSVRWMGTITTPNVAGTYTFYTKTDDGVRLWVNKQLLIDKWVGQSSVEWSNTITLAANTRYLIQMDYYDGGGDARAWLYWQPPGQAKVIVPTSVLRPSSDLNGDGYPDGCADCNGNGIPDSVDISRGTSKDCNGNGIPDSCDMIPSPPAGYWRFEEASGGVVDSGPNALNGTILGSPQRVTTVPVSVVPQTGAADTQSFKTNWQDVSTSGRFYVNDPAGKLTMGDTSFTIEAWVKLSYLSGTGNTDERQYLCQKKALSTGDYLLDYAVLVQTGNMTFSSGSGYGKTSNLTGRELVLQFGTGTTGSFWGITSNLQITDLNWHYVRVSHDAPNNAVHFVVDDQSETITLPTGHPAHYTNNGPLMVGTHQNSSGTYHCFLRGLIDELRITPGIINKYLQLNMPPPDCNANGIPDECDLAAGTATDCDGNYVLDSCEIAGHDCNHNQIFDSCDIANGTSQDCNKNGIPDECDIVAGDCNGNGVPDSCDIANNYSQDCNHNGIPDECEVPPLGTGADCNGNKIPDSCEPDCNGNHIADSCDIANGTSRDCNYNTIPDECDILPESPFYVVDDGSSENTIGLPSPGGHVVWLNHFTLRAETQRLTQIQIAYGNCPTGIPVTVYVWSDPNGDGRPSDAKVLASAATTTQNPLDNPQGQGVPVFNTVPIGPVQPSALGTSFFIGAMVTTPGDQYIIPVDQTPPNQLQSWIIKEPIGTPIDPNNLPTVNDNDSMYGRYAGNWLIRGVAVEVHDCNHNGSPDDCDISSGISRDQDYDNKPDECEPDCNKNGVPDDMDISNGTSQDCQQDGIPDECQLTTGDCNHNGIPDTCDITNGTSKDCNKNQIPDECDIANGTPDCQSDGIPDDCQAGGPNVPTYQIDDGGEDMGIGVMAGEHLAWLNHFNVMTGSEVLGKILISNSAMTGSFPYKVYLWSDPNGDGVPDDSQVLASADAMTGNATTPINTFHEYSLGPVYVGPVGTSFFAGAIVTCPSAKDFPASIDRSTQQRQSWAVAEDAPYPIDPNNLNASLPGHQFGLIDDLYAQGAGNWLIRVAAPNDCNANGIPDDCDITDGTSKDTNTNKIPDSCEALVSGCATKPGDLDGNNTVDGLDIAGFVSCYLQGPTPVTGCACADMNTPQADNLLNETDLALFIEQLVGPQQSGGGCATLPGDMNGDQSVNGLDIQGFVNCVLTGGSNCPCGDFNSDGQTTAADVTAFVTALLPS